MANPQTIDFTSTKVQNAPSGRRQLGIDLDAINSAIADAKTLAHQALNKTVATPTVQVKTGPVGPPGPQGTPGPAGPMGPAGPTGLPTGSIILWNITVQPVPPGFALCDGTNGTPDLHGMFVIVTA